MLSNECSFDASRPCDLSLQLTLNPDELSCHALCVLS